MKKRQIQIVGIILFTLLLTNLNYAEFIHVAQDNWLFEYKPAGSGNYFVPFGTCYWDPKTFVWVGIYDPFSDYDGGVNTCAGNYDGTTPNGNGIPTMLDWVTVAKRTSNDDILIYPPPGNFTITLKYDNPFELKDIFDSYFEDGYADGVYVDAGRLAPAGTMDQLVVSTMSRDDVVLIFFYEDWMFDETGKIEIPSIEGYNDGVKIACGNFDSEGSEELAVAPLYSNEYFNSIKIYKLDKFNKPYLWKEIPLDNIGNLKEISIAAGEIDYSGSNVQDELVLAGVMDDSSSINNFPQIFLCSYDSNLKEFQVTYLASENFDDEQYNSGINIACGRIKIKKPEDQTQDQTPNHDQLITSSTVGQDHIRVYDYDPQKRELDYLRDGNGNIKGKMDDIFADVYKQGLTISTGRLYTTVPEYTGYRDHILIGSMDFKDAIMFRDYHPEWRNNDGWHNFGRANVISEYDSYRTDKNLRLLKTTNINIIKFNLSPGVFIDSNDNLIEESILKLKEFMQIAKKYDLKVLLSMCNWWEGWPGTWDNSSFFAHPEGMNYTLERQKEYFREIASIFKDDDTLFAYVPFDEPNVEWGKRTTPMPSNPIEPINQHWNEWLKGSVEKPGRYKSEEEWRSSWGRYIEENDDWNSYIYPPEDTSLPFNIKLYDYQVFREELAANWVKEIAEAIREVDDNHLIQSPGMWVFSTVLFPNPWGYTPSDYSGFNPFRFVDYVDYLELHLYPWRYGSLSYTTQDYAYIQSCARYCYYGKPLISADFGCDNFADYARTFFQKTETCISGWLNWDAFETDDTGWLNRNISLFDAGEQITELGEFYKSYYANLPKRSDPKTIIYIDMLEALTDPEAAYKITNKARESILKGQTPDFILDYPAILTDGDCNPKEGTTDTEFVFSVRCIDNDYDHPDKIHASITLFNEQNHNFKTYDIELIIDPDS
ncbi:cellulase family glycosylhydrolase, partial [bacterium]|nr:cellulase family glycosylhydrolase [bacterium]